MAAERVIAAVQHWVPVVGVGHPGLEVVGDHLLRAAADIGEGADMGTEPVLVTLGPARFGVGQVRAGQAGNENLRLADDILVDDTQRHASVIDFERLAGAMLPAHRRRPGVSLPGMEMRAELGVAVALRMPAQIFQPQQAQCHAAATQLLLDRLPIRQRTIPMARVNGREQASVKLLLAQLRHGLPVQPDRRGAVEIFLHGRARDPHAARHRCIAQPQPLFEPKHFLDPPHRHLRSWHLPAPPKRGDGSRHYLPLSSEARADQGCRKRRYQVPDWSEIRCRFPPKSPAAFDRNQVPVCSDFCSSSAQSWFSAAQGYFVYDSHKSGAQTISHLRFGPRPIRAPYLTREANFVACHRFNFIERQDLLGVAAPGSTFLLNSPYGADEVWNHLPRSMQQQIIERRLRFFVIDASKAAQEVGLRGRINTILQTCFFALAGVLPRDEAINRIKDSIRKTYAEKGEELVQRNFRAVDGTLDRLHEVQVPAEATSRWDRAPAVPGDAPEFVRSVTAKMFEARGDEIPVSLMPVDGTFPSGTAAFEKRNLAESVPVWEPEICIQCGQCSFVCPHAVIRAKYNHADKFAGAPATFKSAPINVRDRLPLIEPERRNVAFFEALPVSDRARVDFANVRGVQFLEPLFEFSGACAGCGETPYLKLLSQLFGDRLQIANATGCSSIYGANLPVTPWAKNREGRGPAWSNSLFEDNAEFGLGFRLAADKHLELATSLARGLAPKLGAELVEAILAAPPQHESAIRAQRARVATLIERLHGLGDDPAAKDLLSVVDHLVRRSIWIVGGDGWAYDIGYGGLDHVLAASRDVNILVLDTEVY